MRKKSSSIARERRKESNNPLPDGEEIVAMIREAQLEAAETVRAEAIGFLERCLIMGEGEAVFEMITKVVNGRIKEF